MGSKKKQKQPENKIFQMFQNLGTTAGSFTAIAIILTMGVSAGAFFNNIIKNTEILDIKTQQSIIMIEQKQSLADCQDEVKSLKKNSLSDSTKIDYERRTEKK